MHRWLVVMMCLFVVFSCDDSGSDQASEPYRYEQPTTIGDGWETDSLTNVDMDTRPMLDMMTLLNQSENHEVHSVLVVKQHRLVFEVYFDGHDFCYNCPNFHGARVHWDLYRTHNTHSATKSITSTLIGIAIDQGHISSVQDKIFDYLPDYTDLWNEQKDRIRIEHLLTMSAGLEWNEWDAHISSSDNDIIRILMDRRLDFRIPRQAYQNWEKIDSIESRARRSASRSDEKQGFMPMLRGTRAASPLTGRLLRK